jgi:hypothetical protein
VDAGIFGIPWFFGYPGNYHPRLERFTLASLVYLVYLFFYPSKEGIR